VDKKGNKIILAVILCILSIAITIQVKSFIYGDDRDYLLSEQDELKRQNLSDYILMNENLAKILEERQNEYEGRIRSLGDNELEISIKELYEELSIIDTIAGLTEVSGKGIIITLNDKNDYGDVSGETPEQSTLLVHNYHVYGVINELKKAGAQAISINNERVISTTEVHCTGGNININGNRYLPPYEIKAIGNPDVLNRRLLASEIYKELMSLSFKSEKSDLLTIPKYTGNVDKQIDLLSVEGGLQ